MKLTKAQALQYLRWWAGRESGIEQADQYDLAEQCVSVGWLEQSGLAPIGRVYRITPAGRAALESAKGEK